MALYPNLEAEMTRNGVTQRDIAQLLGKTEQTVCNWMNGRGDFTARAVFRIREELFPDCTADYLFEPSWDALDKAS